MINSDALSIHLKTRAARHVFLIFCLVFSVASAFAQTDTTLTDSTDVEFEVERGRVEGEIETVATEAIEKIHSPKKATVLSAVLPGAGQVYNKKYWKVPILYGGFAVAGWYLQDNLKEIERFKDAYNATQDDDPLTMNTTNVPDGRLLEAVDLYKTWRDLSYISIAAIYILNIIDANVDAHLFYFDVGEDISMNIQPFVHASNMRAAGLTLSLKL